MSELGSSSRPLRVGVIGSGPAGFYAAEALFKSEISVQVDMFDRLAAPYGLVRAGVAPDHQKLKNVIKIYERIAASDGFGFLGNVTVGRDVSVEALKEYYDALIFSSGAETDRRLGIPGEDLQGSHTATEFVGWYNGHPDYQDREFDLSSRVAVVIGQGNVAMDVSRILAKTVDELKNSDIAERALEVLAQSKIKDIYVIGRRGPVQAKFTPPEIKEIGELSACDPVVSAEDLELGPACQAEHDEKRNTHTRKNLAILREFASRPAPAKERKYFLKFFQSPVELLGNDKMTRLVVEANSLSGEPFAQKARGTGETFEMDCGILFRSVGYRGVPISGLPFDDQTGKIPSQAGRILESDTPLPGPYVSGWIKRGPSGVIGTNKPDSHETVQSLLEDMPGLVPCGCPDSGAVAELLSKKSIRVVSFQDWQKIDAAEMRRGEAKGKPREKFVSLHEMLAVLD